MTVRTGDQRRVILLDDISTSWYVQASGLIVETMSTRALSIWMQALHGPRHEPTAKHLRIEHGGQPVAETDRALLVWEPRRVGTRVRRAGRRRPRRASRRARVR